jgi:hypothetical protein
MALFEVITALVKVQPMDADSSRPANGSGVGSQNLCKVGVMEPEPPPTAQTLLLVIDAALVAVRDASLLVALDQIGQPGA